MDKSIIKYFHWGASLPSLVLFSCSILTLFMLGFFERRLSEFYAEGSLPHISAIMFSRIPSYLALAFSIALFAICFLQKAKFSIASVALSWLFSCLLMLSTVMSIVVAYMRLQSQLN